MSVSLIDGHIDDDAPRMTDNEIIKALECCAEIGENDCQSCPYFNDVSCRCRNYENLKDALDLINRQKAEIERLQNDLSTWKDIAHRETSYVSIAKAEAVKEFAERLNKEAENVGIDTEGDFLYSDSDNTAFEIYNTVAEWCNEVANTILKEMVGDTK